MIARNIISILKTTVIHLEIWIDSLSDDFKYFKVCFYSGEYKGREITGLDRDHADMISKQIGGMVFVDWRAARDVYKKGLNNSNI